MAPESRDVPQGDAKKGYTRPIAFVYIFNLVVGVGALALPFGVWKSGIGLGLLALGATGLLSVVSATWVVEVVASANALLTLHGPTINNGDDAGMVAVAVSTERKVRRGKRRMLRENTLSQLTSVEPPAKAMSFDEKRVTEKVPLVGETQAVDDSSVPAPSVVVAARARSGTASKASAFSLNQRRELSFLAELFLGKLGSRLFYVALISYLFGDLAIYAVAVPRSLLAVTGPLGALSGDSTYLVYLFVFAVVVTPLSLFELERTKYLQLATTFARYCAMFLMMTLAILHISRGEGATITNLPWVRFDGLPTLFGSAIYAYMCHHSLPGILAPIKNKDNGLSPLLFADMASIYVTYALLAGTAIFAFGDETESCGSVSVVNSSSGSDAESEDRWACQIQPLYTLNFASFPSSFVSTSLQLYPVFTLTANFPVIAITLRNNIMELLGWTADSNGDTGKRHHLRDSVEDGARASAEALRRRQAETVIAFGASLPAFAVAAFMTDVGVLVDIVGSYSGVVIQWIVPALLVIFSRERLRLHGLRLKDNAFCSPFRRDWQVHVLVAIGIFSMMFNTVKHVWSGVMG